MRGIAPVLATALLFAACGGDDETSQGDANVTSTGAGQAVGGSTYVEEGNAACAEASAALLELAPEIDPLFAEDRFPPGAVEPYGETAEEMAAIIEDLAAQLAELEPPGDRELIADQLVSYLETEVTALREIQQAATGGTELDPRIQTGLSVDHLARLGIATATGLDDCAVRVFGP